MDDLSLKDKTEIRLQFKDFRLPSRELHDIKVKYQRDPEDPIFFSRRLERARCDLDGFQPLQSTLDFKVSGEVLKEIEEISYQNQINPSFLAALTAQESGFNPRAVSSQRALGLTQVTPIAEKEILQEGKDWPRYPNINDLNFFELKYKVITEEINPENEWRLNERLSLIGGAKYLDYLKNYWSRADKQQLLAKSKGDLTSVLLASYNIGPAKVSRSIERAGPDWLHDPEGRDAVKYVNMVTSYCETFAKGETE
jgi:hypothetical protein